MKKRKNVWKSMLLAAVLSAGFSMISLADEPTQFVSGTSVNSIGISGMTVEEAKAQIEGFYDSAYKLDILEKGGRTESIAGMDIGYKVTVPEGLQAILDEQNANGRISGPSVDNSHTMQMSAVYDEASLAAAVQALSCISGSGIVTTTDAYISDYAEGTPFSIIPEVQGNDLDLDKVTAVIREAVSAGGRSVSLEETGCYRQVRITSSDESLVKLCDTMNQCREMTVTYTFGEAVETLDGQTICTWLKGAVGGEIDVDRGAAAAYVQALAGKYDTVGRDRVFHTATGQDVTLKGPFGWRMDQAAETDALIGIIRTGQTQSREPQYAERAAARSGGDWGTTYVEVDLAGQHVYMFKDGAVVWDAPCVTGNVAKGYTTPDGIYSLAYKQTDRILRGAKKADGTYEYESHVNYWMPFNGGIGLHDADWRSKFGGTIYKNGGSHGCINLPPNKAKALYDLVYKGIPVICHN